MAVTTLSQTLHDWWVGMRPGVNTDPSATLRSGLVSDVLVGDYLIGARAVVAATGATTSGNRALTLQRRGELTFAVSWPAASTVWFTRP
jgi:hypothetical protein